MKNGELEVEEGREGVIYNRDWVTEEDLIGGDLSVVCDQGLGRLAASPVVPYFKSVGALDEGSLGGVSNQGCWMLVGARKATWGEGAKGLPYGFARCQGEG